MNSPKKEIAVSAFATYEGLVDHFVQSTGIYFPSLAAAGRYLGQRPSKVVFRLLFLSR